MFVCILLGCGDLLVSLLWCMQVFACMLQLWFSLWWVLVFSVLMLVVGCVV